jgi:hypothetical protein
VQRHAPLRARRQLEFRLRRIVHDKALGCIMQD